MIFPHEIKPKPLTQVHCSGVYSDWTEWSDCSIKCAESSASPGFKTRSKTCKEDCADVEKTLTEEMPCWGSPDPTFCSTGPYYKNDLSLQWIELFQTAKFSQPAWNRQRRVVISTLTWASNDPRQKASQKCWWWVANIVRWDASTTTKDFYDFS